MTTLIDAILKAVTNNLLTNLPSAFAERFNMDSEMVQEFLSDYLNKQLPVKTNQIKQRGINGKGVLTGYTLFSNTTRDEIISDSKNETFFKQEKTEFKDNKGHFIYRDVLDSNGKRIPLDNIPFVEIGRRLGQRWNGLSNLDKDKWNEKAKKSNNNNGLLQNTRKKIPQLKVSRDIDSKKWLINNTNFVVVSSKNKTIIGKLHDKQIIALSDKDKRECIGNGWNVKE